MAKEKTLSQRLNDINFSPSVVGFLQGSKAVSRGKKRTQTSTKIQGLETLKNTLGRQNIQKQSDYRTNKF
jgi:hypothetical protein